jgi:peptidoglycan hydrolase CwlO-like protein
MKEEKTKKDNEIDNLNKKVTTLESQLKDKSEKLAVKTAEYKKLEEIAG